MAITIFIVFLLGMFHYIYESIIAPTYREGLRLRLFELRNTLRDLRIINTISSNKTSNVTILLESLTPAIYDDHHIYEKSHKLAETRIRGNSIETVRGYIKEEDKESITLSQEFDTLMKLRSNEISEDVFKRLDDTICIIINQLARLTLSSKIVTAKLYEDNEEFKYDVELDKKIMEECEDSRIKAIGKELDHITTLAFIVNSGGLLYIVAPIFLLVVTLAYATASFKGVSDITRKIFGNNTYLATYNSPSTHNRIRTGFR